MHIYIYICVGTSPKRHASTYPVVCRGHRFVRTYACRMASGALGSNCNSQWQASREELIT